MDDAIVVRVGWLRPAQCRRFADVLHVRCHMHLRQSVRLPPRLQSAHRRHQPKWPTGLARPIPVAPRSRGRRLRCALEVPSYSGIGHTLRSGARFAIQGIRHPQYVDRTATRLHTRPQTLQCLRRRAAPRYATPGQEMNALDLGAATFAQQPNSARRPCAQPPRGPPINIDWAMR
jgi:hypothetical protein